MAARDFSLLPRADFPQALFPGLDRLVDRVSVLVAKTNLTTCHFADEHCDCRDLATVHHLASEQEFCERHFQAVTRG